MVSVISVADAVKNLDRLRRESKSAPQMGLCVVNRYRTVSLSTAGSFRASGIQ